MCQGLVGQGEEIRYTTSCSAGTELDASFVTLDFTCACLQIT